jgi:hypothetical protein
VKIPEADLQWADVDEGVSQLQHFNVQIYGDLEQKNLFLFDSGGGNPGMSLKFEFRLKNLFSFG